MQSTMAERTDTRHGNPSSAFESSTFDQDISIRVDEAVGSASISPSGRDVVLASRQGLHIIDLDSPWSLPRHLPHSTPWEVADVQWSPFAARDYWIVSTSNQKALVWNLELCTSRAPIEHVLHAHSRAITDINFSAHHPEMLATCAVDSFVHCWDLRDPATPAMTFCDWFAGATQVKWNRQDAHIIASSHDKYLRIWDDRKGAYPLRSIEAHATKIYGIDWNRTRPTGLVTCSLDKTIKFWDYETFEDVPERVIRTPFPVWRARHTSFGWGLLAMPQRGNHDLHMYDRRLSEGMPRDTYAEPVHSFGGHVNQVKEFLWRFRGNIEDGFDNRDFQLVSWGTDRELRLHKIKPEYLRAVGYEKGKPARKQINLTRQGARYKTFRDQTVNISSTSPPIVIPENKHQVSGQALSRSSGSGSHGSSDQILRPATFLISSGMQGRAGVKERINLITWMKGVKVGKREGSTAYARQSSRVSRMSSDSRLSHAWDMPESLGDEITHVGDKFKKVNFENVDVNARTATVGLNGPWGQEGRQVYVKMAITFPTNYPETAEPTFKLEKTSSFDEGHFAKLSDDIKIIAHAHKMRRACCLEAVLAYLLGERGLEESTHSLSDQDYTPIRDEESSSDEEDEVGLDFGDTQAQNMELSGTGIMGGASANANVPLPKACGASWAHDGRLVCFFPPKEETKSLLSSVTQKDSDRSSKTPKIFEGFGRLYANSSESKKKRSSTPAYGISESEDSYSSSSSSVSEEDVGILSDRFQPPAAWRGAYVRFQRSRSTERSQQSGSASAKKNTPAKPKSIVSLHDHRNLLPSKQELADKYVVFGDGPSVCSRNAEIAAQHGYHELSDIWRLVRLILMNEVPLEVMPQSYRKEDILVLARRALVRIKRRDSGLDLAFDEADAVANPKLRSRVKWGNHPFACSWLVNSLFEHFEQRADVQMLAMLSCIFHEPAARQGSSIAAMHLSERDVPLSMKSPAFSLDYYASQEVAWSLFRPTTSRMPALQISHTPLDTYGSAGSSNGPWSNDQPSSDNTFPHSTGTTPPKLLRSNSARGATHQSLSSSPEHSQRTMRSSNTSLANALTTSFSRQFYNVTSSSPPSQGKTLDAESDLSFSAPVSGGITWGSNTVYGIATNSGANTPRSQYHSAASSIFYGAVDQSGYGHSHNNTDSEIDLYDGASIPFDAASLSNSDTEPDMKVILKNQDQFDEESCVSVPLLDPSLSWKFSAYRDLYADLLFAWKLWLPRCEVRRFNGLMSYWTDRWPAEDTSKECWRPTHSAFSKEDQLIEEVEMLRGQEDGLELAVRCSTCTHGVVDGSQVLSDGAVSRGKCEQCHRPMRKVSCSICWMPVNGLYKACPDCGHVSHIGCITDWLKSVERGESRECEAGCGCDCARRVFQIQDSAVFELGDAGRASLPKRKVKADGEVGRMQARGYWDSPTRNAAGLSRSLRQAWTIAGKAA